MKGHANCCGVKLHAPPPGGGQGEGRRRDGPNGGLRSSWVRLGSQARRRAHHRLRPCRSGRALPSERVLSDAEIAEIWHAREAASPYGTIIRLLILTGQRRGEVAHVVNFDDGGFCATGDAPRLVAGEQLGCRPSPRLVLRNRRAAGACWLARSSCCSGSRFNKWGEKMSNS